MNLSRPFILRPIATSLLMLAILLLGCVAYRYLPVSALPQADYPTIQIQTFYPGASPEVMTSSVTAPLERQMGQMPGLQEMTSTSSAGASTITLQFVLALSLDVAEQEVQAAINAAGSFLPADLPAPPVYAKVNPADAPILTLAASSKSLTLAQIEDLAESRLAQKIAQLPGVGLVSVGGGQRPAVRIQVNPRALTAYGLSTEDVRNAVGAANVNIPKGNFDGLTRAFAIGANDQIKSAAGYRDLIVAYRSGAPVLLADVAEISDGVENRYLAAWHDQDPAVILDIRRQPGSNVINVVDGIRDLLPQLRAGLPPAVDLKVLTDRTNTIRASVRDVELELLLAALLVVLVIYLFLRDLPATLIPSLSVPLSLVGTFAVMYLAGFSLNNLSLMALTIATGFVVDDAIVMIENIARHIEQGVPPRQAALTGARQIGFTILSLTVSLIAVLIPLLFMGDVIGRLFREFAVTLAVTILISAIVSLTLVPMLCARLMRPHQHRGQAAWQRWMDLSFQRVIDRYDLALRWVLDHSTSTLLVAAFTLLSTAALYVVIPKGFFPIQDTGLIQAVTEAPQTVSFRAMADRQQSLARALLQDPDVTSLSSFVGIDGINATVNTGRLLINLKSKDERRTPLADVMKRLSSTAHTVSGISLHMQPVQDLTLDAHVGSTQFQFSLEDASSDELAVWTRRLLDRLAQAPELADVVSDAQNDGLAVFVDIDRATAGRYGITPAAIDNALYDAFGQRIVSTIMTQSNQYRVILEAEPQIRLRPQSLSTLYVPSASGTQVPLSAFATAAERTVPLRIDHLGQFPVSHISFNLGVGHSLGQAVAAIRSAEDEIALPASVVASFQGAARAFQASLDNELLLILAAIVAVYIVLGVLYESYVHPVTILSTLPSAGVGALLALLLVGSDLGVIGIIGIVLLIGIVKKNAIMMVDFAIEARRDSRVGARQAIHQACLLRFRPILMTTLAALLGALPLMLGTGTGSELRFPLGVSIAGGLIVSQLLTLFTTPVIYLAFDRLSQRLTARWGRPDETEETAEPLGQRP